jgi:hypothetical protein
MRTSVVQASRRIALPLSRSGPEPQTANLSRKDRDHLGERLRTMYDALRDEPLPERLQDVINRLAQSQSK